MANNNLIDHFNYYFEMVPAISDELKIEAYKLRYQVYCIENNFESPNQFPDQLESDGFDQHSVHYLIRHRKSGNFAATTRLILPDTNNPEILFPLELYSKIDNFAVMQSINRERLAEVSRFCVSKAFKQRRNEAYTLNCNHANWGLDNFTLEERRTFPHITFALIACVIRGSYENDIRYLYGSLEPPWLRFLSVMGINFTKIGPLVNYHGERWPAVIKITDLLDSVAKKNLNILNLLTNNGQIEFTHKLKAS